MSGFRFGVSPKDSGGLSTAQRKEIIKEYASWFQNYMDAGWRIYLLTFMFKKISGSKDVLIARMADEIDRVYSILVSRTVRRPRALSSMDMLPILLGCPDLPGARETKASLADITINGGLHIHAVVALPKRTKLGVGLVKHFRRKRFAYVWPHRPLARIDVRRVRGNLEYITDYGLKSFKRGRMGPDHLLIFPKSRSELCVRTGAEINLG
jgi:hypothetical protein